jgi:transcriptional regulator with XRE-family HTH domain
MIVRKLRLKNGWSQEQLSQFSGLSIRTIQRIERGQNAGLESLKSLAAVFEIPLSELQKEKTMTPTPTTEQLTEQEVEVIEHVKDIKDFYSHLINYAVVMVIMFAINYFTSPGYIWAWWVALGWGIGVASHGLSVFEVFSFFGANWEKKQIEKRLGKKL